MGLYNPNNHFPPYLKNRPPLVYMFLSFCPPQPQTQKITKKKTLELPIRCSHLVLRKIQPKTKKKQKKGETISPSFERNIVFQAPFRSTLSVISFSYLKTTHLDLDDWLISFFGHPIPYLWEREFKVNITFGLISPLATYIYNIKRIPNTEAVQAYVFTHRNTLNPPASLTLLKLNNQNYRIVVLPSLQCLLYQSTSLPCLQECRFWR